MVKKAIVQLSGGLDSTTVLAIAASEMDEIYCISFDYGQRNIYELQLAKYNSSLHTKVKNHLIFKVDLRQIGKSALTDNIDVPKNSAAKSGIPITYVPGRNTIFNSISLGFSEANGAEYIYNGINNVDYSGYPDCRPKYIESFEKMANLATSYTDSDKKFKFITPLISLSKAEIIAIGLKHGIDYSKTISCYDPDSLGRACGICDACIFRRQGFAANNVADPTIYGAGFNNSAV